jgi:hypothetical protein
MASGVAAELRSAAAYAEDFGKNAPSKDDLADWVEATAAWCSELEPAARWQAYVKDEATRGWQTTSVRLYALAPAFRYASERDPSVAQRYPTLAALFALPRAAAKRAVATRAAKRKAKASMGPKEPPATPATPAATNGADAVH